MTTPPDGLPVAPGEGEPVVQLEQAHSSAREEIVGLLLLILGAVALGVALWQVDPRLFLGAVGATLLAAGWRLTTPPEA